VWSNDEEEMEIYQRKLIKKRRPSLELLEQIAGIKTRIEDIRLDKSREFTRHRGADKALDEKEELALQELFQCLDRLNEMQTKQVRAGDRHLKTTKRQEGKAIKRRKGE